MGLRLSNMKNVKGEKMKKKNCRITKVPRVQMLPGDRE